MDLEQLKVRLKELEKVPSAEWQAQLAARKLAEKDFHDVREVQKKEVSSDIFEEMHSNQKFYSVVQESSDYFDAWLNRETKDKVVLDFACGRGGSSIKAVQAGAKYVVGIDISPISLEVARERAQAAKVQDKSFFLFGDAENSGLPDSTFDVVICSGMLHHLDLSYALPELRRILRPGGKIIALEALDYNPAIKLYRMRTPHMRTEWEKAHILSLKDIRFAQRFFDLGAVKYFHITGMAAVYFPKLRPVLTALDRVLCTVPGVRLLSWMFCFELIRRGD